MPDHAPPDHPIRIVLFDLDGTLADTAPDLAYALNRTLEKHGRTTLPLDTIRPGASHGSAALIRLGFKMEPKEKGFDLLRQDFLGFYRKHICRETRLFPGMPELLAQLEAHGYRWGVVTNKPSELTNALMEQLGLSERAACIVSGDTTPNSKPHPQPILHACELAGGHPENCLCVGDAQRDIEAGINAGTATLTALFGYIGEEDHPLKWGADGHINHPMEILDWLRLPRVRTNHEPRLQ